VSFAPVYEALAAGQTVVTSTRRLARALRNNFAGHAPGPSWVTPEVIPWPAWLQHSYRQLRDFGALPEPRACLDDAQAAAVWQEVLAGDPASDLLLMPGAAVEGCRDAWRLAHEWCLSWSELQARAGEDGRVFLRVAQAYRQRLEALGVLDEAGLPKVLAAALAGQDGPKVLFAGFDSVPPARQAVMTALGPRLGHVAPPGHGAVPVLAACRDTRHELTAAAAWARTRLEADPAARLGIVVPELEVLLPMLEDLLDEALAPVRLLPGHGDAPRPWNISLGPPLIDVPVVAAAFAALALGGAHLGAAEVSRLLRSSFAGGARLEAAQRARLEAWLRLHAAERIGPEPMLRWLDGADGAPACPRLAASVRGLTDELRAGPRHRRPSAWAAAFTRALARLGWPGDEGMDSSTWQAVEAWTQLLETFSRLDAVTEAISLGDALARLRRLGAGRRFQPENPEVPVQVLGLLETAGLEFDALWVTGMHDGALPLPLRPCPLLPVALQREREMPRACPGTELAQARRTVARLAGAAAEVRFSYPRAHEDEPLRASPVILGLERAGPVEDGSRPRVAEAAFDARRLEHLGEAGAPPFEGQVRGGATLLAAQAACPFKAFAVHRLAATPMEAATAGVDARTRGRFVHLALNELWAMLQDRNGLRVLDAAGRARQVRGALEYAAREILAGVPDGLVEIELNEAAQGIEALLEVESMRPDFAVVARESQAGIELGPLQLAGRIDRVDRVAEGLVVIDYKVGEAGAGGWQGERPAEPQMPLYALAFRAELAGLAYASLRPGAIRFQGLARSVSVLGAALSSRDVIAEEAWHSRIHEWQRVLESLASAFGAGDARVDPLHIAGTEGTCARCHLAVLCRRDELLRAGVLARD
jgi:ATP-dependent helicase/nuclease subunit B